MKNKIFDKIQNSFMIKNDQQSGSRGTDHNIIKVIYDKPTANILLNKQKLELEDPATAIRQEEI